MQPAKDFMLPYKLANELVDGLDKTPSNEDFICIVESFQASGGEKSQLRAMDVFEKLSFEELISRCRKISKLNKLLLNIQTNNALPRS